MRRLQTARRSRHTSGAGASGVGCHQPAHPLGLRSHTAAALQRPGVTSPRRRVGDAKGNPLLSLVLPGTIQGLLRRTVVMDPCDRPL